MKRHNGKKWRTPPKSDFGKNCPLLREEKNTERSDRKRMVKMRKKGT